MGGYRGRNDEPFDRCFAELYGWLEAGKIHPLIDTVVGFAGLANAMIDLYERRTRGRVMFDPRL